MHRLVYERRQGALDILLRKKKQQPLLEGIQRGTALSFMTGYRILIQKKLFTRELNNGIRRVNELKEIVL